MARARRGSHQRRGSCALPGEGRRQGLLRGFTRDAARGGHRRRAFEEELRRAFENGEFELYYQPQVLTSRGQLMGPRRCCAGTIRSAACSPRRLPGRAEPQAFRRGGGGMDPQHRAEAGAENGGWRCRASAWASICSRRSSAPAADEHGARALAESGLPPDALELEIVETILLQTDPPPSACCMICARSASASPSMITAHRLCVLEPPQALSRLPVKIDAPSCAM